MNQQFADRRVLVTGGGSGIGRATARRFATEGALVTIADVDEDGMARTADGFSSITPIMCNVADESEVSDLIDVVVAADAGLDVVVNLAGVLGFANSHEVQLADWRRIIDINLTGTFLVCRAALPHLCASAETRPEGSVLINTASTAAHIGQAWSAAYCASKGGILAMTRALAVEYAKRGVRVNSVSPGGIDTPITGAFAFPDGADKSLIYRTMPLGEMGRPDDVAGAIAYLAGDEAAYVKGTDLIVDGATTA